MFYEETVRVFIIYRQAAFKRLAQMAHLVIAIKMKAKNNFLNYFMLAGTRIVPPFC
jgi:hypothetical protein